MNDEKGHDIILERRDSLRAGFMMAALPVAALAASAGAFAATPAPGLPTGLKLDDPADNVKALVKMAGSLDPEEEGFTHYSGYAFATHPETMEIMRIFRIEGGGFTRNEILADGSSRWMVNTFTLFCDPESGNVLDEWLNPFTGQTVRVWHNRSGPSNYIIAPNDARWKIPWRFAGDWGYYQQEAVTKRPNPIDPKERPRESNGQPFLYTSSHSQYVVDLHQLLDPSRTQVDRLFGALQGLRPWYPWMLMGTRAGVILSRLIGLKGQPPELAMPPQVYDYAKKNMPEFMMAPKQWSGTSTDLYQRYFREVPPQL